MTDNKRGPHYAFDRRNVADDTDARAVADEESAAQGCFVLDGGQHLVSCVAGVHDDFELGA